MPFKASEIAVYMYLLQQCNLRGWQNPFQLPTKAMEFQLSMSRRQIAEARQALSLRGLISFTAGSRSECATYRLLGLEDELAAKGSSSRTESQSDTQTETQPETQSDTQTETQPETQSDTQMETQPTTLYKNKTKIKDKESVVPLAGNDSHSPSCRNLSSSGKLSVSGKLAEYRKSSENSSYHAFLDFLEEEAPSVVRDIGPLTEREFLALKGHFRDSELIASCVRNLESRKDLRKRYSSLYRTLINWCKNGYNQ